MLKFPTTKAPATHSAVALANEFIALGQDHRIPDLNPPKLHDLIYLAHGWHLGIEGVPMVTGNLYAWRDGVFAPSLREAGCWGSKLFDGFVHIIQMDDARGLMVEQTPRVPPKDGAHRTIQAAWKLYGRLPPFDLSRVCKEAGAPWDLIWNDEERPNDEPKLIPNATLKIWFKELAAKRRSRTQLGITDTLRFHPTVGLDATQPMLERPDPDRLRSI